LAEGANAELAVAAWEAENALTALACFLVADNYSLRDYSFL
jgi:hypothetical protein